MGDVDLGRLKIVQEFSGGVNEFTFWDYLAKRSDGPEIALAYGRVFWPELICVDGFVFLKENYNPEYYNRILRDYGKGKIEEGINTTYLENLCGVQDAEDEVWEAFGKILCETWRARAESLFPGRHFVTEFAWYSEDGDPGITLYQRK